MIETNPAGKKEIPPRKLLAIGKLSVDQEAKLLYQEHRDSVAARDRAEDWAADTQHRLDHDPYISNELEIRQGIQERNDDSALMAGERVDANLWRARQHFLQNEGAYKHQAIQEAQAQGVDIDYPPVSSPER